MQKFIFVLNRHAPPGAWHHNAVSFADLKKGFLSDSPRESPPKIGIADRPEAGMKIGTGWAGLEPYFRIKPSCPPGQALCYGS
jgi:hypothetical protein